MSNSQPKDKDPCPVCFENPLHPVTLPCGHTYCFLCGKGLIESNVMSMSSGSCSLCRSPIPPHFFRHPQVNADSVDEDSDTAKGEDTLKYISFNFLSLDAFKVKLGQTLL